ncbi:hypothetical protein APHAL10511_003561 [Amanita phalloides]|nr:hypothetical protein APHAL10511_003561 [Amanita phalloides]
MALELLAAAHSNTSDDLVYYDRQVQARTWVAPTKRNTDRNGIIKRHPADAPWPVATVKLVKPKNEKFWLGPIEVGTPHPPEGPRQLFKAVFDTGSLPLWVTSSEAPDRGSSKTYDSRHSSTWENLHSTFNVNYPLGSCEGNTVSDMVNVGGIEVEMAFGSVTKRTGHLVKLDGTLGLPFPPPEDKSESHFFHAVQKRYPHFNPVAAFCFGTRDVAELHLGQVKDSVYLGEQIEYHQTIQLSNGPKLWPIGDGEISVGGTTIQANIRTILDTGSPAIFGPPKEVAKIYDKIHGSRHHSVKDGQALYLLPCEPKPEHKVELSFKFKNGKPWKILYEDLAMEIPGKKKWCKGAIAGMLLPYDKNPEDLWLAGDPFLQGKYVIFDARNRRAGLAEAKKGCGH